MNKKKCKKMLRKVEKRFGNFTVRVATQTYVSLYQNLMELYFQKKYDLVADICEAILKNTEITD